MAVNIEHEDQELDQLEGLRYAAHTLLEAADRHPAARSGSSLGASAQ
jgi:hypothetical protein